MLYDFAIYLIWLCGVLCFIPVLWFVCCQASMLQLLLTKLHLPCKIRIHKVTGFDNDEDHVTLYPFSQKNVLRFNVDVNIDGNIIAYLGRY